MTKRTSGALGLMIVMLLVALTLVRDAGVQLPNKAGAFPPVPQEQPRSDLMTQATTAKGLTIGTLWPFGGPASVRRGLSGQQDLTQGRGALTPDQRQVLPTSGAYRNLLSAVVAEIRAGRPTAALHLFNRDKLSKSLKTHEYDAIRGRIAAAFYFKGDLDRARKLAQASANRSGDKVPYAAWIAGLTNWRMDKPGPAMLYFEMVAASPQADGWTQAAGAYWAARSASASGKSAASVKYLRQASQHKYTFYGLIAARALGITPSYDWSTPELSTTQRKKIAAHPEAGRVFALVKAGRYTQADRQLRTLNLKPGSDLAQAVYAYALRENLPGTALHYTLALRQSGYATPDSGLYPKLAWLDSEKAPIDPALTHAIIRQESRFSSGAESTAGARGLMQLMPDTARFVRANAGGGAGNLDNPQHNVRLGQAYIAQLLDHDAVAQDLLALAIAYNAGPGNLTRWQKQLAEIDDPLLFIESIPASETRAFVERVMANYWIYTFRMSRMAPSLSAVASGHKAVYRPDSSLLSQTK